MQEPNMKMNPKVPAIVCDADKLSQIAIIQELGRLGVPVIALSASAKAIGFGSRYVRQGIVCDIPSHDDAYVEFLISKAPRGVLFYSNDANTENISRNRQRLVSRGFSVFVSDPAALQRVIHKDQLFHTARECGVSVPRCALVSSAAELEGWVDIFGLPLILKSTNLAGGIYRFVTNRDAAAATFQELSEVIHSKTLEHRESQLMAQQWIPQSNIRLWNFNACVQAGKIVSFCMGRRLRTDVRPDGSLGSMLLFGETAFHAGIFEENRRLLEHVKFDGLVETEWSEGTAGRGFYLYDFNPRPSGNIRWVFRSGVSLAGQYYRLALGLPAEPQTMKIGTKYAKVFYRHNDFLHALEDHKRTTAEKLRVLADDLMIVIRCGRHGVDVLDPKDPGPTFRACAELGALLLDKLRRRWKRFTRTSDRAPGHVKYAS
jgi:predicted ATP-grasp superfamily ATP-dependent carboligase